MAQIVNIGLLGAGRIGQVHAKSMASHAACKLVAVSDIHMSAAAGLASAYGAKVTSTAAILQDPNIHAVLIATSTDTHADLIEAATAAGKAVFCEKPVDLSLSRAQACLQKVQSSGKAVMIGFNRRFDPHFATLKKAFDAGDIGKGELLAITSFDPSPPPLAYIKASGGLFRDMTIHDFDTACWIFDGLPLSVSAIASNIVDPALGLAGDMDTAVITLHYADGRIAVIKNSRRAAYGYDQRLELLGEKGLLQAGNVLQNTVHKLTSAGEHAAKPESFFLQRYLQAYQAEWVEFIDAVQSAKPYPVNLQDGVNALRIAEAAIQSYQEGCKIFL